MVVQLSDGWGWLHRKESAGMCKMELRGLDGAHESAQDSSVQALKQMGKIGQRQQYSLIK